MVGRQVRGHSSRDCRFVSSTVPGLRHVAIRASHLCARAVDLLAAASRVHEDPVRLVRRSLERLAWVLRGWKRGVRLLGAGRLLLGCLSDTEVTERLSKELLAAGQRSRVRN